MSNRLRRHPTRVAALLATEQCAGEPVVAAHGSGRQGKPAGRHREHRLRRAFGDGLRVLCGPTPGPSLVDGEDGIVGADLDASPNVVREQRGQGVSSS